MHSIQISYLHTLKAAYSVHMGMTAASNFFNLFAMAIGFVQSNRFYGVGIG